MWLPFGAMRILVTGAAGRIGSTLVRELHEHGHEVVATDHLYRAGLPVPLHLIDLCEHQGIYRLLEGCDGVIHVGNHPHPAVIRPAQRLLQENVAMNANVFFAALEVGVPRIIFTSSIQAVSHRPQSWHDPSTTCKMGYLPFDQDLPFCTNINSYAMSKMFGEQMLEEMCRNTRELAGCSVRLPYVSPDPDSNPQTEQRRRRRNHAFRGRDDHRLTEGLTYLPVSDAARVFRLTIERMTPGYRRYFPAQNVQVEGYPAEEFAKRFMPEVPIRGSLAGRDSLVDLSTLKDDLGWEPTWPAESIPAELEPVA